MTSSTDSPPSDAPRTPGFEPESRLMINGALREATGGTTVDNVNPATEEVLGRVADGSGADMDSAIAAARHAFDTTSWATDHEFRAHCLRQLQEALDAEADAARAELIAEAGAPMSMTYIAQFDWPLADALRYPTELISQFEWSRPLVEDAKLGVPYRRDVVKEPLGVVGAITPWNFPFEINLNKVGQILATGNTMVLKPAIETPWTALRLGRLVAEHTDIPAGVFNVVSTADNAVAEQLVNDARVDMISFTGSTGVGVRIQELSAKFMRRNLLELGGKSALIVLDDADLTTGVGGCIAAAMHAGQGCALTTRVLVPRKSYDEAVEIATATFGMAGVGSPTDPTTMVGPLISARQRERVLGLIESGKAQGARVTLGGGVPDDQERGYFVSPTVFADVTPDMRIFQEEIFGPVITVTPYDDDDDAVALANNSRYGLAATIMGSPERANAVARRVRAGSIMMNGAMYYGADAPFGGYKLSGIGRQNGIEGFEQHLETKTIAQP